MQYTIKAYSPTARQTLQEFNLEMGNPAITNKVYAEQIARAFAHKLNQKQHLKATDWEPKVELEDVGIHTIPGYIQR